MSYAIMDIFILVLGIWLTFFHKRLGHKAAEFYFKFLHIRFNERGYQIGFFIGGLFFIVIGILSLLGVVHFR